MIPLRSGGEETAFASLRQALRAPDRHGWRRFVPFLTAPASTTTADSALDGVFDPLSGGGEGSRTPSALGHRMITGAGVAVVLAAGLLALTALRTPAGVGSAHVPTEINAPSAVATAATAPPATTSTRLWPAAPEVPLTIEHDGHRFGVGAPGDVVAVGDWNCDGRRTAALLRPVSGQLVIFDQWPENEAEVTARPVATEAGAIALTPAARCGRAVLRSATGSSHEVPTESRAP